MKPGIYKAKIIDYALTETKAGLTQMSIKFQFDENQQMVWYGSFKEGRAAEITLEALRACGFTGETNEELFRLNEGVSSGLLDTNADIEISLDEQMIPDGTKKLKIVRVGSAGFKPIDIEKARAALPDLSDVMKKIKPRTKTEKPDEAIPF